VGLMFIIV